MDLPKPPPVVLTRPLAQSRRFAKALQAASGYAGQVIISPLTRLAFLDDRALPRDVAGLIFTSETGVKAFARANGPCNLPAWVVGPRTASAANALGMTVQIGSGNAAGLAAGITTHAGPGKLLYVRGKDVAFPLEETLLSAGMSVESWLAYEQRPVPANAEAMAAMAGDRPVILPLFSVQAARRAAQAFQDRTAPLFIAAISKAVSDAWSGLPARRRLIALRPDEQGMSEAVVILADEAQRP